jgi:hypothetical protein
VNGSFTLLAELSLDAEEASSEDDPGRGGVKPGEVLEKDGDCGLKISDILLRGLKLFRLDCCRLDRGVVDSSNSPVVVAVVIGVRVRRIPALPEDSPVTSPLTPVFGRVAAAAAADIEVEPIIGRLTCVGGLGVSKDDDDGSTNSDCCCCAEGEVVFRGEGVKKSRRFLGLDGVSSPDGDDAGNVVATSAVGDTGLAAADGGVWSLATGPVGDGLDDSVDAVATSCKGCDGVDDVKGPCPSGC